MNHNALSSIWSKSSYAAEMAQRRLKSTSNPYWDTARTCAWNGSSPPTTRLRVQDGTLKVHGRTLAFGKDSLNDETGVKLSMTETAYDYAIGVKDYSVSERLMDELLDQLDGIEARWRKERHEAEKANEAATKAATKAFAPLLKSLGAQHGVGSDQWDRAIAEGERIIGKVATHDAKVESKINKGATQKGKRQKEEEPQPNAMADAFAALGLR